MRLCYDIVLFDLDGTLFESGEGILNTVRETLARFRWPVPEPDQLRRFIGPANHYSYEFVAGMPHQLAQEAAAYHRAAYRDGGWRACRLYPGVRELLRELRAAGAKTAVASTKPRPALESMLNAFGLAPLFDAVAAGEADGTRGEKPYLIACALEGCGAQPCDRAVMVGDTRFDAAGARDSALPFIGVLYGYGTREEMAREGASAFAGSVEELRALLLREGEEPSQAI